MKNVTCILLCLMIGSLSVIAQESQSSLAADIYLFEDIPSNMPPNCLSLNDTLMCDRTEISNIDWKEYVQYNKRVFGEESKEYMDAYLDTSGYIMNVDSSGRYESKLPKFVYYLAFEYDEYPVVGISLDQAKRYSQWRSDRVFEMYLIESGLRKLASKPNKKNHFTIEKYLKSKGATKNIAKVTHYPQYFIPSIKDWDVVKAKIKEKEVAIGQVNSREKAMVHQSNNDIPMVQVRDARNPQEGVLYGILGNVAEMLDDPTMTIGGSYEDSLPAILEMKSSKLDASTQGVGFRNFCKWVKI